MPVLSLVIPSGHTSGFDGIVFNVDVKKIFAKISSMLGFQRQHISYHHEGNESSGLNMTKNIFDMKGKGPYLEYVN